MRSAAESSERDANGNTPAGEISAEAIRAALEKILASSGFATAERLSRFLRYTVEESLHGQTDKLKESFLGVEVFGRKPTYDPRVDAVVRTEAVKLRARLRDYYESEGREDEIVIDLPKGGYVPAFRNREKPIPPVDPPGAAEAEIDLDARSWRKPLAGGMVLLALLIAVLMSLREHRRLGLAGTPELSSIAVLPFIDLSPGRNWEYFCDGMTDEIIDELTKIGGLRVVARTSSFAFKGQQKDIREIGKKLNVGAVLEGSVRVDGNRLRVTAQFVSVADGYHLWSETYERELKDVFALQDEISRAIVNLMQVKLAATPRLSKTAPENMQAYDLYLQGRYHWGRWRAEGAEASIQYFQQAINKDPNYAAAYAGVADSYTWLGFFGALRPNEAMPKARVAAQKALALDDSLAAAHTSLAYVKALYEFDWPGAEREFKRAIELNPGLADAHFGYGIVYLFPVGRADEGLREMKLAHDLDPLSLVNNTYLGLAYEINGQREAAIQQYKKTLELDPTFAEAHLNLANVYLDETQLDRYMSELDQVKHSDPASRLDLAYAFGYAIRGRKEEALNLVRKWEQDSGHGYARPTTIASVYAALGDRDQAMTWLEKAYDERDGMLAYIGNQGVFRRCRSDPRFIGVMRKVGVPLSHSTIAR